MMKRQYLYKSVKYLAAGAFLLLGRYVTARLVSTKRGSKLHWAPPANQCYVKCPSGNIWQAQFDGPANARPLVFIHGLNANHQQWYYQRRYFNKSYRLVFLDMPMYARSYAVSELAVSTLAADLNNVLNYLNLTHAVIYGHSMGGMVLMQYVLQHPNQVNTKGIIVNGASYTNPILTNPFAEVLKPLQQPVLVPLLKFFKKQHRVFNLLSRINFLNGISSFIYRFILFAGNQTANQLIYVSAMAPTNDTAAAAESVLQLMQFDITRQVKHIKLPSLIISGLYDRFNTVAANLYLHRQMPQSQLKLIAAGHQGMVEKHEQVNTLIAEFMQRL
jgi:pimeloyl-ACP methyl ester carboxylesterase